MKQPDKKTVSKKPKRRHHELEDSIPKALWIFMGFEICGLRSPAYRVYAAFRERWNIDPKKKRWCVDTWELLALRAGMDRNSFKMWTERLAQAGFIVLEYAIWRKPTGSEIATKMLLFSSYEEALLRLNRLRGEGLAASDNPTPYITPPKTVPDPADHGLYLANNSDRYYRRYDPLGISTQGVGEESTTPNRETSSPLSDSEDGQWGQTSSQNEYKLNASTSNESSTMVSNSNASMMMNSIITTTGVTILIPLTYQDFFKQLPLDICEVVGVFCEEYVDWCGKLPPEDHLSSILDVELQDKVRSHLANLKKSGGDLREWISLEITRLEQFQKVKGATYRPPQVAYLGNKASFNHYHSILMRRQLEDQAPAAIRSLGEDAMVNLLRVPPESDQTFVRQLAVIKTYMLFEDRVGYQKFLRSVNFASFNCLRLRRDTFTYAAIKYHLHFKKLPAWVSDSSMRFADEMFDEALESAMSPSELERASLFIKEKYQQQ